MGCIWAAPEFGWLEALDFKERETGIEPATSSLGNWRSIENKEQWRLWSSF
jgi:hypothetical protein